MSGAGKPLASAVAALLLLAACQGGADGGGPDALGEPPDSPQPTTQEATLSPAPVDPADRRPTLARTVAEGLQVPWGVAFLPDGTALVSERDTARVLAVTRQGRTREVGSLAVDAAGEGGLLGLAVAPTYDEDGLVYAYLSTTEDNRVVRMPYDGNRLGDPEPVLTGIPKNTFHDGGRLLFDADGMLLVSTGDAGRTELAQDRDSTAGKILRITPDGDPAPGNPVSGNPVWTMGHRNVQGLAFDDDGRLWATEFGAQTWDELNLIEPRRNYGWPLFEGPSEGNDYRDPFVVWRTSEASPSGLAFLEGSLWAGALRGTRLWQVPVSEEGTGEARAWFVGDFGRLRTVTVTPWGALWVTTSNRDGRGDPSATDDRILEVTLS